MRLIDLVSTSTAVSQTRSRIAKRDALAVSLTRLAIDEIRIGVSYLSGRLPQGRIGIGPATLTAAADVAGIEEAVLTLHDVDEAVERVAATTSTGSARERKRLLGELFGRCTREEQSFLVRLFLGELRQGALDGLMIEAIARAANVSIGDVRRAAMLSGDLASVAATAFAEGKPGLARFQLVPGEPIESMLAQTADGIEDAIESLGRAVLDLKMDGARVQVHKHGRDVAVFSRRLNEVSSSVPEVVEAVAQLPADSVVLDGEAIAFASDGRPLPFQATMRRFGRKRDVGALRTTLPLSVFFFDCMHAEGASLLDEPLDRRLQALDGAVPERLRMPRIVTDDLAQAQRFLERARAAGHEGVMAKSGASRYEAGNRGSAWLKVKPAHTLDLVILAAEWGHGRRRGWLSNLHLGARDDATGSWAMLGKTFKGLTDEMLEWQTQRLLELEVARDAGAVHVRPELVVEIAFNEVQSSPHYASGLALRHARVKAYRTDKRPEDANTLDDVRGVHALTSRTQTRPT